MLWVGCATFSFFYHVALCPKRAPFTLSQGADPDAEMLQLCFQAAVCRRIPPARAGMRLLGGGIAGTAAAAEASVQLGWVVASFPCWRKGKGRVVSG